MEAKIDRDWNNHLNAKVNINNLPTHLRCQSIQIMNKKEQKSPLQRHRNSIDVHPYNASYGMPSINQNKTKSSNLLLALIDDHPNEGLSSKLRPKAIGNPLLAKNRLKLNVAKSSTSLPLVNKSMTMGQFNSQDLIVNNEPDVPLRVPLEAAQMIHSTKIEMMKKKNHDRKEHVVSNL